MPTVNAGDHKQRFSDLQPDDMTQAEFIETLLDSYEIVEDEGLDMEEIIDMIDLRLGTQVELASYRGAKMAIEDNHPDL